MPKFWVNYLIYNITPAKNARKFLVSYTSLGDKMRFAFCRGDSTVSSCFALAATVVKGQRRAKQMNHASPLQKTHFYAVYSIL